MLKRLSLVLFVMLFYLPGFCQVKEIIDRDLPRINELPEFPCPVKSPKQNKKLIREFKRSNLEYMEILKLDTLAIPYLIDKISDTTETAIEMGFVPRKLKIGDVAFDLLHEIIVIPMGTVAGLQWDYIGCDGLDDYLYYLQHDRLKFQTQLRQYFAGSKGKAWVRLMKHKLSKEEYDKVVKEL